MQTLNLLYEKIPSLKDYSSTIARTQTENRSRISAIPASNICICYGISIQAYLLALPQLENSSFRLVFLEDSAEELLLFAKNPESQKILEHSQISFHYLPSSLDLEEVFRSLLWKYILESVSFVTTKEHPFAKSLFNHIQEGVQLTFSDYSDFGKKVLRNIVQNLSSMSRVRKLDDAKNALKNIPAFIVGAGPSLDQDYKLLDPKKAVIFSGGSALAILAAKGIQPHFAATIDKQAPCEVFAQADLQNPYFLFQLRANPQNVRLGKTPGILASSNGGYPLEEFITKGLNIGSSSQDFGWNVSTFLCHVAAHMGCSPIILVGQDLCHSSSKAYAQDLSVRKEQVQFCKAEDSQGKKVFTQRDWLFARSWFCNFSRKHPGRLQNATSRGLGFPQIPDFAPLPVFPENIAKCVEKAIESMPCYPLLTKNLGITKSLQAIKKGIKKALVQLESLYEKQQPIPENFFGFLEKQLFYQKHIEPMWSLFAALVLQKGDRKPHTQALQKLLFCEELATQIPIEDWHGF